MDKKKVAVMQPYFLPYLEYWRLIYSVDIFIIYDNIQFSKGGWIKRNRFLLSGKEHSFSIPINKASDYLNINERTISEDFALFSKRLLNQIKSEFKWAPNYDQIYKLVEEILSYESRNLFEFIYFSITKIVDYLGIKTKIIKSSSLIPIPNNTFQERLLDTLKTVEADVYFNPISGQNLYSRKEFADRGIELRFLDKRSYFYNHYNVKVSDLSILDLLMFVEKDEIIKFFNTI
jgi:hypothetical protein